MPTGRSAILVAALLSIAAAPAPGGRLLDALRNRDTAAVTALLRQKADVNATDPDGSTALHWAAHWNERDLIDQLVRAGAAVNAVNAYGATPLWLASEQGAVASVERLLAAGADAKLATQSGETSLMAAARTGSVPTVQALLKAGAEVDRPERARGQTALMWAAAERQLGVMRALLAAGANVNAASSAGFTPLMFAAREGDLEATKVLIESGGRVNAAAADGATPLIVAAVRGHVPLAEYLLAHGADPNAAGIGYTALHWAAGIWETSTTFDYRFTRGEWAALEGIPSREEKLRLIKALIARGADVNAVTTKAPPRYGFTQFAGQQVPLVGATPFFLAALAADSDVMKMLAAAGADPKLPSKDGNTPLIVAAGRARVEAETRIPEARALEAVRTALDLGIDVNAANTLGETALHAAALGGLDSVVQLLVDRGAAVNVKTKEGKTPLALTLGTVVSMQVVVRPSTTALLRKLGGQE